MIETALKPLVIASEIRVLPLCVKHSTESTIGSLGIRERFADPRAKVGSERVTMAFEGAKKVEEMVDRGLYPRSLEALFQSYSEWNVHNITRLVGSKSRPLFNSTGMNFTILKTGL